MKNLRVLSTCAGRTNYPFAGYVKAWPFKWADAVNDDAGPPVAPPGEGPEMPFIVAP